MSPTLKIHLETIADPQGTEKGPLSKIQQTHQLLCSGATHSRLTLGSGCSVTFLLSLPVTNHELFTIWFYYVKVINSTRQYSALPSRLPRSPNGTPPKIHLLISQGRLLLHYSVTLAFSRRKYALCPVSNLCFLVLSSTRPI